MRQNITLRGERAPQKCSFCSTFQKCLKTHVLACFFKNFSYNRSNKKVYFEGKLLFKLFDYEWHKTYFKIFLRFLNFISKGFWEKNVKTSNPVFFSFAFHTAIGFTFYQFWKIFSEQVRIQKFLGRVRFSKFKKKMFDSLREHYKNPILMKFFAPHSFVRCKIWTKNCVWTNMGAKGAFRKALRFLGH